MPLGFQLSADISLNTRGLLRAGLYTEGWPPIGVSCLRWLGRWFDASRHTEWLAFEAIVKNEAPWWPARRAAQSHILEREESKMPARVHCKKWYTYRKGSGFGRVRVRGTDESSHVLWEC